MKVVHNYDVAYEIDDIDEIDEHFQEEYEKFLLEKNKLDLKLPEPKEIIEFLNKAIELNEKLNDEFNCYESRFCLVIVKNNEEFLEYYEEGEISELRKIGDYNFAIEFVKNKKVERYDYRFPFYEKKGWYFKTSTGKKIFKKDCDCLFLAYFDGSEDDSVYMGDGMRLGYSGNIF